MQTLAVTLDEEEGLTIGIVASRVRQAMDVERLTKRFYERFKKELATFQRFIDGIAAQGDREWYASLMLNRMMFIYFVQKKGFLDGDPDYLRNRLAMVQRPSARTAMVGSTSSTACFCVGCSTRDWGSPRLSAPLIWPRYWGRFPS